MMEITLDAACLCRKETAHTYLRQMLGFPDYYGGNLDALYDCLTECEDLKIIVENCEEAGDYTFKIIEVMRDADVEVELR